MAAVWGCSKISAPMEDSTPATRNWAQDGEEEGAQKQKKIAGRQLQLAGDAQKIQSDHGDDDADPDGEGDLLFQKQAQQGHQDDIEGSDESGLARVGAGADAGLLEIGGNGQGQTAAEAADHKLLPILLLLRRAPLGALLRQLAEDPDDDEQHHHSDHKTRGVEGHRTDLVGAHILGHEGSSPDQRRQKRKDHLADEVILFHRSPVLIWRRSR